MAEGPLSQNSIQIGPAVLDKNILKVWTFPPLSDAAVTNVLHGIKFFEGHIRIILVIFFLNMSICLGKEVENVNERTDGRTTMLDAGR